MSQDTIKKLTQLKEKIDDMKVKKQSAQNNIDTLQKRLLEEFGAKDIDEAEDILDKWDEEIKQKESALQEIIKIMDVFMYQSPEEIEEDKIRRRDPQYIKWVKDNFGDMGDGVVEMLITDK